MSEPSPAPGGHPSPPPSGAVRPATAATPPRAPLPRAAWALGAGGLALGLAVGGCTGLAGGAAGGFVAAGGDGALASDLLGVDRGRSVEEALPDELPALRAFVARARGLEWTREVPVRALEDEAFEAALSGEEEAGAAATEDEWPPGLDDPGGGRAETYAALGLTPSASAFVEAWEGGDAQVAGFYDTLTREVVLRGARWTPAVEETLVHELVHALDHQHVDLDAHLDEQPAPEAVTAGAAVVEGDAESITWQWYDQLDEEALAAHDEAAGDADLAAGDPGAPYDPLVDALTRFPYDYGYVAVEAVADEEGPAGVSDLLREPFTTTEQVLAARPGWESSPGLAGAVDVDAPAAPGGAEVLGSGGLGLFPLSLLPGLADAEDDGYWLEDVVTYAWAGDAWTTWVDPADEERACTAVLVRLEDARGRDDLAADLEGWVADAVGVGASLAPVGKTDLELRGCGER